MMQVPQGRGIEPDQVRTPDAWEQELSTPATPIAASVVGEGRGPPPCCHEFVGSRPTTTVRADLHVWFDLRRRIVLMGDVVGHLLAVPLISLSCSELGRPKGTCRRLGK